jgi:hypothetical protein
MVIDQQLQPLRLMMGSTSGTTSSINPEWRTAWIVLSSVILQHVRQLDFINQSASESA